MIIDAGEGTTADPSFAKGEREYYESRTRNELLALAQQAWNCNSPTQYQLARSYMALRYPEGPAPRPGDAAAIMAEETGTDYATCLVACNMD